MKYNRTEIDGGIGFSSIIDEKFKSCSLTVKFIIGLDRSTAAENVLAVSALTDTSSDYNTIAAMSEALTELYGAGLSSSARKRGDLQILSVNSSWLADRYALDGEDISGEMLNIFSGCLFRPNVVNGEFEAESFRINKMELLDRIEAELNNKSGYALSRAQEIAFSGEPAENSCYGFIDTAEAATASSVYAAYKRIMQSARIEAFFVAPQENPYVEKMLRDGFSAIERKPENFIFRTPSLLKAEPVNVSEEFDVLQCKMVMAFKSDSDDIYAMRMMSLILGETPVSKLFVNVREKLGICYYCSCQLSVTKNTIFIDCGIERSNIEKTKTEIIRQLDEIKNGNISDEDVSSAVLFIQNSIEQIGDTMSSYTGWYFERFCEGKIITAEEMTENYKNVTKERIIAAARSFSIDSIYIMLNKEDNDS